MFCVSVSVLSELFRQVPRWMPNETQWFVSAKARWGHRQSAHNLHAIGLRVCHRDASRNVILRAEDDTRRPPHRGTEGLKCLDEHTSLDGHV